MITKKEQELIVNKNNKIFTLKITYTNENFHNNYI